MGAQYVDAAVAGRSRCGGILVVLISGLEARERETESVERGGESDSVRGGWLNKARFFLLAR